MPLAPVDGGLGDIDRGMGFLVELAELLPATPLVPIDEPTVIFDRTAPLLIDHAAYAPVRQALDDATVESAGPAAGDRAQSRAIAFLRAKRPAKALREIHAAKIDWLRGESDGGDPPWWVSAT